MSSDMAFSRPSRNCILLLQTDSSVESDQYLIEIIGVRYAYQHESFKVLFPTRHLWSKILFILAKERVCLP
jgi:hypothetical protein